MFGLALVATLVGPKGAVSTTKTPAPEGSNQLANRLSELVRAALKAKAERLVVFIRDDAAASSAAVRDVVAKYVAEATTDPTANPTDYAEGESGTDADSTEPAAGRLLSDDTTSARLSTFALNAPLFTVTLERVREAPG